MGAHPAASPGTRGSVETMEVALHDDVFHFERGFLRAPRPGTVELALARPFGLTEVAEGTLDGTALELRSLSVGRAGTGSPVSALMRRYRVDGDTLAYELDMAMDETAMARHLVGSLRREPA